jgi:predicted aldo/keto reductase-like oxidoreductase
MEYRQAGKTDMRLSLLGFGGFHLIETDNTAASRLLNAYLDRGGNYIETAARYADGVSERRIGSAVAGRRREYFLASKAGTRDKAGAKAELERSLKNLRTDYLDVFYIHSLTTIEDLHEALDENGAIQAALEARDEGKIRYIGATGHGRQEALYHAVQRFPFDLIMTGFNYYDRFNFPSTEDLLLPAAEQRGTGVLAMKAFGDGFLHASADQALRYVMSLPVATIVVGMNTMELLEKDFSIAENETAMTEEEKEKLFRHAPELGDYVCRLCGECAEEGFDPESYFLLEGLFDRQMDSRRVEDAPRYALRERLKHWFGQQEAAKNEYASLKVKIDPAEDYRRLNSRCPYGIDVDRKLKIIHEKLTDMQYLF